MKERNVNFNYLFQTAYEVVANVKDSFANFTSTVLKTVATAAPVIGTNNNKFQNEVKRQFFSDVHLCLFSKDVVVRSNFGICRFEPHTL